MPDVSVGLVALALALVVPLALLLRPGRRAPPPRVARGPSLHESLRPKKPVDHVIAASQGYGETVPLEEIEQLVTAGWDRLDRHRGATETLVDAAAALGMVLAAHPEHAIAWAGVAEAAMKACYLQGQEYDQEGLGRAAFLARKALLLHPSLPDALGIAAEIELHRGRLAEAEETLALLPDDHWRKAWVLGLFARRDDDVDGARRAWRAAAAGAPEPRRPMLLNAIGGMLLGAERWEEAGATFDEALALDRNLPWAWYNRAICHWHLGEHEPALAACEIALSIGEFGAARQFRDRLLQERGGSG